MLNAIRNKLSEFRTLSKKKEKEVTPKINQNKIRMSEIEKEVNDLLSKVVGANAVLMQYINERVENLDVARKKLQEENISLTCNQDKQSFNTISSHVQEWDNISFEDKQSVVNALIKIIKIADGKIEILWNI